MRRAGEQNSFGSTRRKVLVSGAAGLAAIAGGVAHAASEDEGVTAPEDLMKEHGVLNRCLLIYEEGMRRIQARQEIQSNTFEQTAGLIRRFVEQYHEKNEETYIFPVFQKAGKLNDLVDTLLAQHKAGRVLTARILDLSKSDAFRKPENQKALVDACHAFIRMYRPHEAREDTVLFPALRTILKPKEVLDLGDRMEQDEHKVLGNEGFEKAVDQVAGIEKTLGIYDLRQFTPKV